MVSWDSMQHVIRKADLYQRQPVLAPNWYAGLHWEDVMIGLLLNDYATFQPHGGEHSAIGGECNILRSMAVSMMQQSRACV